MESVDAWWCWWSILLVVNDVCENLNLCWTCLCVWTCFWVGDELIYVMNCSICFDFIVVVWSSHLHMEVRIVFVRAAAVRAVKYSIRWSAVLPHCIL
jgi:hypothetical protein